MRRDLNQLSNHSFDLVVIGGGIHGAWIAWDAALRGLVVALIERGDFGGETSANSLKTVHGGLRYLQDADIGLVRMMIQERSAYLRIAPHLVHPLPCLMPTYSKLTRSRPVMGMALTLNDLFGFDRNRKTDADKHLPSGQLLSRTECLSVLPGVADTGITGGAVWYDGQIYNSERFTLSLIKSAASRGAVVANYVEARGFLKENSRVTGVKAKDVLTGDEFDIRCKMAINAAGPWVDQVLGSVQSRTEEKKFHHSLAMNIIVKKFISDYAAGIPSWSSATKNGNGKTSHMLFISPWREYSLVGTFHSHYQGDPDQFRVGEELLNGILDEVNSAYPGANLELADVCFVHRGFLPEVEGSDQAEVKLVRSGQIFDHKAEDNLEGLISVVGVKYTSARRVAEKVVNLVFRHSGKDAPACTTHIARLQDGQMESFSEYLTQATVQAKGQLNPDLVDYLVRSYGAEYPQLKQRIATEGSSVELSRDASEVLRALTLQSVHEEMAVRLTDVILRRTSLGSAGKPEASILQTCAEVMGKALGWGEVQKLGEIDAVETVYQNLGIR